MMDTDRERIRTWLRDVMTYIKEDPTNLARRSGLHQTTITRFLNKDDASMMTHRTMTKIAHATGVPVLQKPGTKFLKPLDGLSDEAEPFELNTERPNFFERAVMALTQDRLGVDPWYLETDALELAGCLPNDVLVVNLHEVPEVSQIVCVEHYKWEQRKAYTIFRVYQPPYVVAASRNPAHWRPLLIDDDSVVVKGVVEAVLRNT